MAIDLNPYLNFDGTAREAMEFYRDALGGMLEVLTFGDSGFGETDEQKAQVMHSDLRSDSFALMASDTPPGMPRRENGAIALTGDDESFLRAAFDKLAAGASQVQPLETAPWGATFGMLTDRYGVVWMFNVVGAN